MTQMEIVRDDTIKTASKAADWNPTQVDIEDLNFSFFKNNFNALVKDQPWLAQKLQDVKDTQAVLVHGENGYDIKFRDDYFYGMGGNDWAKTFKDAFENPKRISRLVLSPPDTTNLDDRSNETVYRIMKRAVSKGISFAEQPTTYETFHLVVFGIALGEHIPSLIKRTKCRHLVLVEPNIEFLYLSLFTFDWAKLFKNMKRNGRELSIIVEKDYQIIAGIIRSRVRYMNPAFMDSIWFLRSYTNAIMLQALEELMNDRDLLIAGLGFLEDEMDMVRNSYFNLRDCDFKYYIRRKDIIHVPAFIIGGGPSLDNDLEFIRQNQNNAIIISCGTALRSLLHADIRPDFQVEMENVPAVTQLHEKLSENFNIRDIMLIASSTIDPDVKALFDKTVFYFRSSLASYPFFNQGDESCVENSIPTVSNLGFSLAQEIGCRTIYTFGTDLGTRDPSRHHAKDAPYNVGDIEFDTKITDPVPGNFGGTVLSEMVYLWSKDGLEMAIRRFPASRVYYNCADGVRIEGTIPKLSSTIKLQAQPEKADIIRKIWEDFPAYTPELFEKSWTKRNSVKLMKAFTKNVLEILKDDDNRKVTNNKKKAKKKYSNYHFNDYQQVVRLLIPENGVITPEIHYLRGSSLLCLSAIYVYYQRIRGRKERKAFLKISREEFIKQVNEIEEIVLDFYKTLET